MGGQCLGNRLESQEVIEATQTRARLESVKHDRSAGRPRVVIVDGGFAGLNAAKRLARRPVDLTVIDRENHHLFQPLLYQVATAVLSPCDESAGGHVVGALVAMSQGPRAHPS